LGDGKQGVPQIFVLAQDIVSFSPVLDDVEHLFPLFPGSRPPGAMPPEIPVLHNRLFLMKADAVLVLGFYRRKQAVSGEGVGFPDSRDVQDGRTQIHMGGQIVMTAWQSQFGVSPHHDKRKPDIFGIQSVAHVGGTVLRQGKAVVRQDDEYRVIEPGFTSQGVDEDPHGGISIGHGGAHALRHGGRSG